MGIVKVKRDTRGGANYLKAACNYIFNGRALAYGGYMVNDRNAQRAFDQMMIVKNFYHRSEDNPLIHIIVSYDKDKTKDQSFYAEVSRKISEYFREDYQVLWCLHKKETVKSLYHAHIVVNSVNINNGKLLSANWSYCSKLTKHIEKLADCKMSYYFEIPDNYTKPITPNDDYDFE